MKTTHNYVICFSYAAETPREAISHLLGLVLDPESQNTPFDWLVIDTGNHKEYPIRCTFKELEEEAGKKVDMFMAGFERKKDSK